MDTTVFADKNVSKLYNSKFICLKIDMEKGEGIALREKFNINEYPTLLYINPDGQVVQKTSGFVDKEQFIEMGNKVLSGKSALQEMTDQYEKGDRSIYMLKEYAWLLKMSGDVKNITVADEWFMRLDPKIRLSIIGFNILSDYITGTGTSITLASCKFLEENRATYEKRFSKQKTDSLIAQIQRRSAEWELKHSQGKDPYSGKYETNGMIIQVAMVNKSLTLIVPGSPLQKMIPAGTDKFKTNSFSNEIFVFVRKNGKIESMISQQQSGSLELKKISDTPDDFNKPDSLLSLKRSTRHFRLLYSPVDSTNIDLIAGKLEADYSRILKDLKVKNIPVITVRIYPTLKSFHHGINFPNAPDNILATAFGKDDLRTTSSKAPGIDSAMIVQGLAHEFTHCVHLNIDYSPNNPRWLWEGIAMYESNWFFDPKEIDIIKNKQFPQLASLSNGMEYMLGYVIIEAIKDIWGFNTVITLIRKRGNIQATLKLTPDQFEQQLFRHIYKKYIEK